MYKFELEDKKHIYYYMLQCLDQGFGVLKTNVKFNYDGSNEMNELPEGCMPPTVPSPDKNPCENGFALGSEVVEEIGTMLVKKIIHNPSDEIPKEGVSSSIDNEKLQTVIRKLPDLAAKLEDILENNHSSNLNNREPHEKLLNEDGTETGIFHFTNGDVAERTIKHNGDIETIFCLLYTSDAADE